MSHLCNISSLTGWPLPTLDQLPKLGVSVQSVLIVWCGILAFKCQIETTCTIKYMKIIDLRFFNYLDLLVFLRSIVNRETKLLTSSVETGAEGQRYQLYVSE